MIVLVYTNLFPDYKIHLTFNSFKGALDRWPALNIKNGALEPMVFNN